MGLFTISSLAGCTAIFGLDKPPPIFMAGCEVGELSCAGNVAQICNESQEWVAMEQCDLAGAVCHQGECVTNENIVAGGSTTCTRASNGDVYCWGNNDSGQAGSPFKGGGGADQSVPRRINLPVPATDVALGGDSESGHACAVLQDGGVYCWGDDSAGQCGPASAADASQPERVTCDGGACLFDGKVKSVRAGLGRTCAITGTGELFCWGKILKDEVSSGEASDPSEPRRVSLPGKVDDIVFGAEHTCARVEGRVFCWGDNSSGQRGVTPGGALDGVNRVDGLEGVLSLAAGDHHTCALTADGVYCWGDSHCSQTVTRREGCLSACSDERPADPASCAAAPARVIPGEFKAEDRVLAGAQHTCLSRTSGEVSCWGHDGYGQSLPIAQRAPSAGVVVVTDTHFLIADTLQDVALGSYHGCGIRRDGEIWCWGRNDRQQLAVKDVEEADKPYGSPGPARFAAEPSN